MSPNLELPKGDSPTLTLVHPTKEEQSIQFKLNSAEWRGALSPSAYLRRETILSQQALTKDGGITILWIQIQELVFHSPAVKRTARRHSLGEMVSCKKLCLMESEVCSVDSI